MKLYKGQHSRRQNIGFGWRHGMKWEPGFLRLKWEPGFLRVSIKENCEIYFKVNLCTDPGESLISFNGTYFYQIRHQNADVHFITLTHHVVV